MQRSRYSRDSFFAAPFRWSSKWHAASRLMASRFLVFFLFGVSPNGFPRMDPTMFAAETVKFELFSTFPFFASALILPRTDHFKLLVCISVRGSWSISFHFFPFQVTYCSSRWFAILGPFPAATIDFSNLFPTYLESVPPQPRGVPYLRCFPIYVIW